VNHAVWPGPRKSIARRTVHRSRARVYTFFPTIRRSGTDIIPQSRALPKWPAPQNLIQLV
jgi:hypothetical protein